MLDLLKNLIQEGRHPSADQLIERQLRVTPRPDRITVIQGVRRCGKSAYQQWFMMNLIKEGVPETNLIHIDFSDSRLRTLRRASLDIILKAYQSLYPDHDIRKEKLYFFLDEVQRVGNWPTFVMEIRQQLNCEVFLTASTQSLFTREDTAALRPECDIYELFPFSYLEYLRLRGVHPHNPPQDKELPFLSHMFERYMEVGGFPAAILTYDKESRLQRLQNYVSGVICTELFQHYHISDPLAFSDLAHHLLGHVSQTFTSRQIINFLKSNGHECNERTVQDFMRWMEDFYFIAGMEELRRPGDPAQRDTHWRILSIDHSLSRAVSPETEYRLDSYLRNAMAMSLRHTTPTLHYYRCDSGAEVDFCVTPFGKRRMLIQVRDQIAYGTPEWENTMNALSEAMYELDISEDGYLVTNEDRIETWIVNGKVIQQVPAYRFILHLNSTNAQYASAIQRSNSPPREN